MVEPTLHDTLFQWLQSLEVEPELTEPDNVSNGVAMARALARIDPRWFTPDWLSKIDPHTGDNRRLKLSNVKKVCDKLLDYYQECFGQSVAERLVPEPSGVARSDPEETTKLLQLMLGCAVNCDEKQVYIERIMEMEEAQQRALMECIQALDTERALSLSAGETRHEPLVESLEARLAEVTAARDQLARRTTHLQHQVTLLQEEMSSLVEEKRKLKEEIELNIDSGAGHLRRQLDAMKEEVFRMEQARDDYRLKGELRDKEVVQLRSRIEELQREATRARELKDELDVLRETADRVNMYEATLDNYKKKLEETADLRRQLKHQEGENKTLVELNQHLEQELSKANFWKTNYDASKKQSVHTQQKLELEVKRADTLMCDLKTAQDGLSALTKEKERLRLERDSLREALDELECVRLQPVGSETPQALVTRRALQVSVTGEACEAPHSLALLLDETKHQLQQARTDNQHANLRIVRLEADLKQARDPQLQSLQAKLMDLQHCLDREKRRCALLADEKEAHVSESSKLVTDLREKLATKESELQEAEEKQRRCVEKAKAALRGMDPTIDLHQEVSILRSQLAESQREQAQNEALMASAFHQLAAVKHRESGDQRLGSLGTTGHTFLSRQRQQSHRRPTYNTK